MHDHRLLDAGAGIFATVAVASFWQGIALALTILAAIGSLSLVGLRWYIWFKYGNMTGSSE